MDKLEVYLLNCGQGNCAFIRNGAFTALIDANVKEPMPDGSDEEVSVDLIPWIKKALNGAALDYLVITHPHRDHIEGLSELLGKDGIKVSCLVDSGLRMAKVKGEPYPDYDFYLEEVKKRQKVAGAYKLATAGTVISLGSARLRFLSPDSDYSGEEKDDAFINRQSCVIRLDLDDKITSAAVLFLADTCRETFESDLAGTKAWELLRADVIVAAHHGSKYFFYACDDCDCKEDAYTAHVEKMEPEHCFVSCAEKDSPDSHPPHPQALKLYKKLCGKVHRSDLDGHAVVTVTATAAGFNLSFEIGVELEGSSDSAKASEAFQKPTRPMEQPLRSNYA